MITYTMGEDAVSGADVFVDENNGLLYQVHSDETKESKEPEPKTCPKCEDFVDENHTGFYAMGCKRDGTIIPITAEIENLECFKGKSQEPEIRHNPQEDVTCEQCQTAVPPDRQWECPTCHIQFASCPHCDPDQKIPKPKEHESGGMTFMQAVVAMRDGKKVKRKGWPDWCGKDGIFKNPNCEDFEATDWEVV